MSNENIEQSTHRILQSEGFSIVPMRDNKAPNLNHGEIFQFREIPATLEQIKKWEQSKNTAAWGVIPGKIKNFAILDFDGQVGIDTFNSLGVEPNIISQSGAYHLYISQPSDKFFPNKKATTSDHNVTFLGIESKSHNCYAGVEGKIVATLKNNEQRIGKYQFIHSSILDYHALPPTLIEELKKNSRSECYISKESLPKNTTNSLDDYIPFMLSSIELLTGGKSPHESMFLQLGTLRHLTDDRNLMYDYVRKFYSMVDEPRDGYNGIKRGIATVDQLWDAPPWKSDFDLISEYMSLESDVWWTGKAPSSTHIPTQKSIDKSKSADISIVIDDKVEKQLLQQTSHVIQEKAIYDFEYVTAENPNDIDIEDLDFIVENNFARGNYAILAAKRKTGKSTQLTNIAIAVATGQDYIKYRTQKSTVFYFCIDDSLPLVKRRLKNAGIKENVIVTYIKYKQNGKIKTEQLSGKVLFSTMNTIMEKWQTENNNREIGLVIIDSLANVSSTNTDLNKAGDVDTLAEDLKRLARMYNCAIVVSHSLRKPASGGVNDIFDEISGSSSLTNTALTSTVIKPANKEFGITFNEDFYYLKYYNTTRQWQTNKDMEDCEHDGMNTFRYLKVYPRSSKVEFVTLDSEKIPGVLNESDQILKIIKDSPGIEFKTIQFSLNSDLSERRIREKIGNLIKQNLIYTEGKGQPGDPFKYNYNYNSSAIHENTDEEIYGKIAAIIKERSDDGLKTNEQDIIMETGIAWHELNAVLVKHTDSFGCELIEGRKTYFLQ